MRHTSRLYEHFKIGARFATGLIWIHFQGRDESASREVMLYDKILAQLKGVKSCLRAAWHIRCHYPPNPCMCLLD
jgi:hypothetical protein